MKYMDGSASGCVVFGGSWISFNIGFRFSFRPKAQRWLLLQCVPWRPPPPPYMVLQMDENWFSKWILWENKCTCSPSLKSNMSARVFTDSSSAPLVSSRCDSLSSATTSGSGGSLGCVNSLHIKGKAIDQIFCGMTLRGSDLLISELKSFVGLPLLPLAWGFEVGWY